MTRSVDTHRYLAEWNKCQQSLAHCCQKTQARVIISLLFRAGGGLEELELRLVPQFFLRAWQKYLLKLFHWSHTLRSDQNWIPQTPLHHPLCAMRWAYTVATIFVILVRTECRSSPSKFTASYWKTNFIFKIIKSIKILNFHPTCLQSHHTNTYEPYNVMSLVRWYCGGVSFLHICPLLGQYCFIHKFNKCGKICR